jgi:hypothetical protein
LRLGGWFAAALAVAVAVILLAGPAQPSRASSPATAPPSPIAGPEGIVASSATTTVRIVPAPSGTPTECVRANVANPYPQGTAGYLSFNGNLFALPVGSVGSTSLCYNATTGDLSDHTDFSGLPGAVQNGVLGYPEAIVGENLYGGLEGRPSATLPLPAERERNLTRTNVWITTHYTVTAPGASPYDFAFDDWLTQLPANGSSTGNEGNRIEIMIWLSNDIGMYLPQTKVSIPTFVNGSTAAGTWYRDDLCMGTNDITFDFLYAPTGTTPGYGLSHGTVSVNLTSILRSVASVLRAGACWATAGTTIGSMYASAFPLGAEFYPTLTDTAQVDWRVSSLCYVLVPGAPRSGGPAC